MLKNKGSGGMDLTTKAHKAVEIFEKNYPDAVCSLAYKDAFQLLTATRLAAQCTDARVNIVTPVLFGKYPDIASMADAPVEGIENCIKSCGLYKTKARDIKMCAVMLRDEFGGAVPDSMEDLLRLPGIGRKTANLVLGDAFGKSAVVVDTHCIRITKRLGFHNTRDAVKIEKLLREVLPPEKSNDFCHRLVLHGRAVCTARKPYCDNCCLKDICDRNI